jgi:hypothetical protein
MIWVSNESLEAEELFKKTISAIALFKQELHPYVFFLILGGGCLFQVSLKRYIFKLVVVL